MARTRLTLDGAILVTSYICWGHSCVVIYLMVPISSTDDGLHRWGRSCDVLHLMVPNERRTRMSKLCARTCDTERLHARPVPPRRVAPRGPHGSVRADPHADVLACRRGAPHLAWPATSVQKAALGLQRDPTTWEHAVKWCEDNLQRMRMNEPCASRWEWCEDVLRLMGRFL